MNDLWWKPGPGQRFAPLTRIRDGNMQRRCSMCGIYKPLTGRFFVRDKRRVYGFTARCKICINRRR